MKRQRARADGFTVLEILVACAVLALLVVLLAQVLAATSSTTGEGRERIAADREARLALDRLAVDLQRAIVRPDVAFEIVKDDPNDALIFFSEVPGTGNGSPVSLIGYRVTDRGLERASVRVPWDEISFDPNNPPAVDDADYRVLAAGVFRFEIGLLFDGDLSDPTRPGRQTFSEVLPASTRASWFPSLRSMVVTLAVLDPVNRERVADPSSIAAELENGSSVVVLDTFTSAASPFDTVVSRWSEALRQGDLGAVGGPSSAVRFYSRVFPLP